MVLSSPPETILPSGRTWRVSTQLVWPSRVSRQWYCSFLFTSGKERKYHKGTSVFFSSATYAAFHSYLSFLTTLRLPDFCASANSKLNCSLRAWRCSYSVFMFWQMEGIAFFIYHPIL